MYVKMSWYVELLECKFILLYKAVQYKKKWAYMEYANGLIVSGLKQEISMPSLNFSQMF